MSTRRSSHLFRAFEIEALRYMLGPELSAIWLDKLDTEAELVSYNYSGSGYFLTVSHPVLPKERSVFSAPPVIGAANDVQAGFLCFVQDGELMLECHTWGAVDVPADFREMNVSVQVVEGHSAVRVSGESAA